MTHPQSCLLGIDIGTTTIKVAAFEANGQLLTLHRIPTPTTRPSQGWAEHNADELWSSVVSLIGSVLNDLSTRYRVEAIAAATVGEAGVLVDANGEALHPIIAWYDIRARSQARWWEQEFGRKRIFELTGMPSDHYFGANKLLWVRENYPEILQHARWWLSVGDLIVHRLSGAFATDQTLASRTMLFNQRSRTWASELISAAQLDPRIFPPTYVSGTKVGTITPEAARLTGLSVGTPVVLGGHDHLCGAYAVRQGQDLAVDSTGTAEVVVLPASSFLRQNIPESGYMYCYADVVPDRYVYSARVGYAGALVDWLRREIVHPSQPGNDAQTTSEYHSLLSRIPTPLEFSGLICLPTFGRVISPNWHIDEIYGAFIGLTLNHHKGHMLQAILEGTSYSLRANLETIEQVTGLPVDTLRVVGGATKNPFWMQLKADITGRKIQSVKLEEAAVLGAALLAGVGAELFADHREAARRVDIEAEFWYPDERRQEIYDRVYREIYRPLANSLKPINHALMSVLASQVESSS
jgi:xylulokinase